MNTAERLNRIAELVRVIDVALEQDHISAEWDINEILGAHDGVMSVIREAWGELKQLLTDDENKHKRTLQ